LVPLGTGRELLIPLVDLILFSAVLIPRFLIGNLTG